MFDMFADLAFVCSARHSGYHNREPMNRHHRHVDYAPGQYSADRRVKHIQVRFLVPSAYTGRAAVLQGPTCRNMSYPSRPPNVHTLTESPPLKKTPRTNHHASPLCLVAVRPVCYWSHSRKSKISPPLEGFSTRHRCCCFCGATLIHLFIRHKLFPQRTVICA